MAPHPSTKPGALSSTSSSSNIVRSRHGQVNSKDILKMNDDWTTTIGGHLDLLKELPLYPITSDTPLRQTLDTFSLKRYQEYATEEFPDLAEDDIALELYARKHTIEGIFYREDGHRCVVGPDLNFFKNKDYSGRYFDCATDRSGRCYFFPPRKATRRATRRANVDRPKPAKDQALVAHCSEPGWHLPTDHARHIMNLPIEILRSILELCVIVEAPTSLQPHAVTCNWKRCFQQPDFSLVPPGPSDEDEEVQERPFLKVARRDDDGAYTELRRLYRAAIDATCLRACKTFNAVGSELLYGKNDFHFEMVNTSFYASPPSLLHPEQERKWRPDPCKPTSNKNRRIKQGIKKIQESVEITDLPGWTYYDHFLRFLWTIGHTNASMIKSLQFDGMVKLHRCSEGYCYVDSCRDGLIQSLGIYIPFIIALCPNLERITIYAQEDTHYKSHPQYLRGEGSMNRDEALGPFLEDNMRKIPGLKHLEVFDGLESMEPLGCAEPVRTWLKDRNKQQAKEALEERIAMQRAQMDKKVEVQNLPDPQGMQDPSATTELQQVQTCDFCGEDHVWAVCHNLCGCGNFGHLRKDCDR